MKSGIWFLDLRDYQLKAVAVAETAVVRGQKNILLAMATGTSKTVTALALIYRFLKSERFRRILFLVDRTALGQQALDKFSDVKLEKFLPLSKTRTIKFPLQLRNSKPPKISTTNFFVRLTKPQVGERCNYPACGTFGFMIAAAQYIKDRTDDFFDLPKDRQKFKVNAALHGLSGGERIHVDLIDKCNLTRF